MPAPAGPVGADPPHVNSAHVLGHNPRKHQPRRPPRNLELQHREFQSFEPDPVSRCAQRCDGLSVGYLSSSWQFSYLLSSSLPQRPRPEAPRA